MRNKPRNRRTLVVLFIAVGMLLISACGSGNEEPTTAQAAVAPCTTPTPDAQTEVASSATPTPDVRNEKDVSRSDVPLYMSYGEFGPPNVDNPRKIRNGAELAASIFWHASQVVPDNPEESLRYPEIVFVDWPVIADNPAARSTAVSWIFRGTWEPVVLKRVLVEPDGDHPLKQAHSLKITLFVEEGRPTTLSVGIEVINNQWIVTGVSWR